MSDTQDIGPLGDPAAAEPNAKLDAKAKREPDGNAVRRYLLYTLSLPERALRTSVGLVGGVAREATSLLVPQAFQDSKTYRVLIQQNLDFLVEDVGGVKRMPDPDVEEEKIDNFVARKAVGNFVDAAGLLTLHVSPFAILAILGDVAYGANAYLRELAEELKKQGVIAEDSSIDNVDDLLAAVSHASSDTAQNLATPPVSVEGLKETIDKTREAVKAINPSQLLPKAELQRMWQEMRDVAGEQDVGMFAVSTAMTMHALGKIGAVGRGTLSGVKVAGGMIDRHVIEHYRLALTAVRERGVYRTLAETAGPYIEAVWNNFASEKDTVTEDVVSGRMFGRVWRWIAAKRGAKSE